MMLEEKDMFDGIPEDEIIKQAARITIARLTQGKNVKVQNVGSFKLSAQPEKQGRNPRTGETITIAPKTVVKFSMSDELKEMVKGVELD